MLKSCYIFPVLGYTLLWHRDSPSTLKEWEILRNYVVKLVKYDFLELLVAWRYLGLSQFLDKLKLGLQLQFKPRQTAFMGGANLQHNLITEDIYLEGAQSLHKPENDHDLSLARDAGVPFLLTHLRQRIPLPDVTLTISRARSQESACQATPGIAHNPIQAQLGISAPANDWDGMVCLGCPGQTKAAGPEVLWFHHPKKTHPKSTMAQEKQKELRSFCVLFPTFWEP